MDENVNSGLENVVNRNFLQEKGYRQKGMKMYRLFHDHEIVFIEVAPDLYIYEGVHYIEKHCSIGRQYKKGDENE